MRGLWVRATSGRASRRPISGGTAPGNLTITQNTCAAVAIAVRGKCSITIPFVPTATGSRTANLVLVDDASNNPQTVPLTGKGR